MGIAETSCSHTYELLRGETGEGEGLAVTKEKQQDQQQQDSGGRNSGAHLCPKETGKVLS